MMTLLGWLQLGGIIALFGSLLGAGVASGLFYGFRQELEEVEPGARLGLLVTLVLSPALFAAVALGVVFAPSLLDLLGVVRDHCHAHPGHHAFHACFLHSQPPAVSLGFSSMLLLCAGYLVRSWGRTVASALRVRRRIRAVRGVGSTDDADGVCRIDTPQPLAMTVGLFSPRVYISGGLRDLLSESQFSAVVSHERAHAERFHSLLQFMARCLRPAHLGGTGRALVSEIELACEQICDRAAANSVGDELSVAEAILRMERKAGNAPDAVLGFGNSAIERRVKAMLQADFTVPNWGMILGVSALLVAAVAGHYDWLHHAIETWLGMLV